jgi:hypothetical protein
MMKQTKHNADESYKKATDERLEELILESTNILVRRRYLEELKHRYRCLITEANSKTEETLRENAQLKLSRVSSDHLKVPTFLSNLLDVEKSESSSVCKYSLSSVNDSLSSVNDKRESYIERRDKPLNVLTEISNVSISNVDSTRRSMIEKKNTVCAPVEKDKHSEDKHLKDKHLKDSTNKSAHLRTTKSPKYSTLKDVDIVNVKISHEKEAEEESIDSSESKHVEKITMHMFFSFDKKTMITCNICPETKEIVKTVSRSTTENRGVLKELLYHLDNVPKRLRVSRIHTDSDYVHYWKEHSIAYRKRRGGDIPNLDLVKVFKEKIKKISVVPICDKNIFNMHKFYLENNSLSMDHMIDGWKFYMVYPS